MGFLGSEAKSFLRIWRVRLKLASIAKIENVDLKLQAKYLSDYGKCTDQAMK